MLNWCLFMDTIPLAKGNLLLSFGSYAIIDIVFNPQTIPGPWTPPDIKDCILTTNMSKAD